MESQENPNGSSAHSGSNDNGRDQTGRFVKGNPGGPGRPTRSIERDYLAALGDAVSLCDWQTICRNAVTAALNGDAKARDWITKHVIGKNFSLQKLAEKEARGLTSEDEVAKRATMDNKLDSVFELFKDRQSPTSSASTSA